MMVNMLYGQIKLSTMTYDPQEGLRFDADKMFPGNSFAEGTFKNDWFTDEQPDQFTIRSHGAGQISNGQTINQFSGANGEILQHTEGAKSWNPLQRILQPDPGLSDDRNNKYVDLLNQHRSKIKKILSFACNGQGTMKPETYERMMGHDLDHISMVPPGKLGLSLAPTSNYLTWLASFGHPGSDAVHDYAKENGQWIDKGLYNTKLDNALEVAAPIGVAAGGYALYKDHQNNKKDKHHDKRTA